MAIARASICEHSRRVSRLGAVFQPEGSDRDVEDCSIITTTSGCTEAWRLAAGSEIYDCKTCPNNEKPTTEISLIDSLKQELGMSTLDGLYTCI